MRPKLTAQDEVLLFINVNGGQATHAELVAACKLTPQQVDYALRGLMSHHLVRSVFGVYQLPTTRFKPKPPPKVEPLPPLPSARTDRFCTGCSTVKPMSDFYSHDTRCKPCRKKRTLAAREQKKHEESAIVTAPCENAPTPRHRASE